MMDEHMTAVRAQVERIEQAMRSAAGAFVTPRSPGSGNALAEIDAFDMKSAARGDHVTAMLAQEESAKISVTVQS